MIILIALFLRVFLLSSFPSGFFSDEASNGYDAYAILTTLRDQHGQFLPLFLKAFNDGRESLYVLLTVPFIKIFGLNEFSTRLPAALLGTFTVASVYYLGEELLNRNVGLLSALLLAVSPWHIHFSRVAFRAILLPLLLCLGLIFFFKSFQRPRLIIVSSLWFGLSLHTYAAARGFIPLLVLGLVILYRKELYRMKKYAAIAACLFLAIFVFLLTFWISPEGMSRADSVGIIQDPVKLAQNYASYFSPNFLFINGDPLARHSPPRLGQLHFLELITVLLGVFFVFKKNIKHKKILLLWLLLYPFPAFLTAPSHAVRSIVGAPLFPLFSACGVYMLKDLLHLPRKRYVGIMSGLLVLSMLFSSHRYFLAYPTYNRVIWQYGMREAITYAEDNGYDCVFISPDITQSYIFPAFYTQYSPTQLHAARVAKASSLGKYQLKLPLSQDALPEDRCLFIVRDKDVESLTAQGLDLKEVYEIDYLKGSVYLRIMETKPDLG